MVKVKVGLKMKYDCTGYPVRLVAQYKVNRQLWHTNIAIIQRYRYVDSFLNNVNEFLNSKEMERKVEIMIIEDIKSCKAQKHKERSRKEKEEEILDKLKNIKFEFEINGKDLK